MQIAGALAIARVPAIYVFPTVKDGIMNGVFWHFLAINSISNLGHANL